MIDTTETLEHTQELLDHITAILAELEYRHDTSNEMYDILDTIITILAYHQQLLTHIIKEDNND
jgi:hypothetical protein